MDLVCNLGGCRSSPQGSEIALSHSAVTSGTREEPEALGDWPGKGDMQGGPDRHGVQHGGEDGGAQWGGPPRERLSAGRTDTSLGRRGKSKPPVYFLSSQSFGVASASDVAVPLRQAPGCLAKGASGDCSAAAGTASAGGPRGGPPAA